MKKLGKKKHEFIETIEAYSCHCYALSDCNCNDRNGEFQSVNNTVYNRNYAGDRDE
ncbi:CLI_3235 family bacteriocin precursor [Clostridium cagae]|uniref:CLI_3235 family bacteriocin precursor n=1 Tax=Clostridium cagae TaxID=2080751 RepID=UPI003F76A91E